MTALTKRAYVPRAAGQDDLPSATSAWSVLAILCVAPLAAGLTLGACTPRTPPPPASPPAQQVGTYVPGVGTFACVTPHHVCPNRFDIELRQEPCNCKGENGAFHYYKSTH